MLVCAGVLFLVGYLAGASWRVALVAALGLALSSTAIALQVFAERNLMATPSGQAGFSILLFQDVAAIPILALLPLLAVAGVDAHEPVAGAARAWQAARIVGKRCSHISAPKCRASRYMCSAPCACIWRVMALATMSRGASSASSCRPSMRIRIF